MPGNFIVKASQQPFLEGEFGNAELQALPDSRARLFDEGFVLKDRATGKPLANVPYRILLQDGSFLHGITDEAGRTEVVNSADIEELFLEIREA